MIVSSLMNFAATSCNLDGGGLFGLPRWYKYLDGVKDTQGKCAPSIEHLSNVWLVVAAIIEILVRIGAIAAVIMVIYGGFTYVTSQGEPDATKKAKDTIVNALVGLAISVMAAAIIAFVAGSIS